MAATITTYRENMTCEQFKLPLCIHSINNLNEHYIMLANLIALHTDHADVLPIDMVDADPTGSTYAIASFTLKIVDHILSYAGLGHNTTLETGLYAAVVFAISIVIGYIAKWVILGAVRKIGPHWNNDVYTFLTSENFFTKLCRMVPAIVFLIFIQFTLVAIKSPIATLLTRVTLLYVIYVTAIALTALVRALWRHIDIRENKRHLPLNGLIQLINGAIWILAIIVAIAVIVDKSPAALLTGLGAFAAVLMLVFKDSILGLVAGVQLSENDSLHVGDWIQVNGTNANGTVTEVSLTAVKVQNWDKTTTSVPPYSLISGSFTNYRTMQESHTRRIQRTWMIDADSIVRTTPELLDRVRKLPFMDEYITKKLAQKAAGKVEDVNNSEGLVNGTIDTNLGLLRAYVKMWLGASSFVAHDSDCFVSTLQQTGGGVPFQIYCFTATSAWFAYEAMQDTIMEELSTILPVFDLVTFENPSGRDTVLEGYLEPNAPANVFGVPQPFFKNQIQGAEPAQPAPSTDNTQAPKS